MYIMDSNIYKVRNFYKKRGGKFGVGGGRGGLARHEIYSSVIF